MTLIRNLLFRAARKAVSDPQVRAKAGDFCREELVPRINAARDEMKDLSRSKGASSESGGFLRALGRRVGEINRADKD